MKPIICWISMLLISLSLLGQKKALYHPYHYTDEDGLLQNTAYQVLMDKDQYLWVLTQYGLARMDGLHVKNYLNAKDFNLEEKRITDIFLDIAGNVYGYDNAESKALFKLGGTADPEKIENTDTVFLNSRYRQAFSLTQIKNEVQQKDLRNRLKSTPSFYYTPVHELYIFTSHEIRYYAPDGTIAFIPLKKEKFQVVPVGQALLVIYEDLSCDILQKGKILINKKKHELPPLLINFFSGHHFFINPSGSFLLNNNQLYQVSVKDSVINLISLISDLNIPNVADIFMHRKEDILFISSSTDGLYAFKRRYFNSFTSDLDIENINNFYAQVELQDSRIFSARAIVDTSGKITPQTRIPGISWSALTTDNHYNIYFSDGYSLFKTDSSLHHIEKITDVGSWVRAFLHDTDKIWFASASIMGYIEKKTGVLREVYNRNKPKENPLPDLSSLFRHNQQLWIGTKKGLYIFNEKTKQAKPVKELENRHISCIVSCDTNMVFIGTKEDGPYLFSNGKFIPLPLDKNTTISTVNGALPDKKGFLWISTNRALLKTSIRKLVLYADGKTENVYYYYYYKEDGFSTNEFNGGYPPVTIAKKNGFFSFSSLKGLVWFDPQQLRTGYFPEQIFVEKIWLNDTVLKNISPLELPADYSRFSIGISVPYWGNKNNLQLDYRLNEEVNKWFNVDESHVVHFNKLSPGQHTIYFRARTGFGEEQFIYKQLQFKILPFWYETNLFYVVMVILLLILIYIGGRLRLAAINREKWKLDVLVKEKTYELNQTMRQLGNTVDELVHSQEELNKVIEQKEKLTSILAHDLRTPLRFITLISEYLNKNIGRISIKELEELSLELNTSSKSTFALADELLTWLSIQKNSFKTLPYQVDVVKLLEELQQFFSDIAHLNKNKIILQGEKQLFINTDNRLLKIILRNLIDNAIKNTKGGTIILSASLKNNIPQVVIADTGKGMTKEDVAELFEENTLGFPFQIKNKLGFQIVKDLIKMINGNIEIESEPGKGTQVTICWL